MKLFYENELSVEELALLVTECELVRNNFVQHNGELSKQLLDWKESAKKYDLLVTKHPDKRRQKSKRKSAVIVENTLNFVSRDIQYGETLEVFKKYYSVGCALIENKIRDYGVLHFESALDWFNSALLTNFDDVRRFELEISNSGLKELKIIVKTLLVYYYRSDDKHKAALKQRLRPFYRIANFKEFIGDVNVGEEARLKCVKFEKAYSSLTNLAGVSRIWSEVLMKLEKIATTDATVLLTGPPGVGKGAIARAIHCIRAKNGAKTVSKTASGAYKSQKPSIPGGAFTAFSCGDMPDTLASAVLFGYNKGHHTGAPEEIGCFEMAKDGVLFLDEIDGASMLVQHLLLKPLQDKVFNKGGATVPLNFSGKVVVATNKDLDELVTEGKFRYDLLTRINGLPITVPSLSDRPEDIEEIVSKFSEDNNGERLISMEAVELIANYFVCESFADNKVGGGNVRALESCLCSLAIYTDVEKITKEHLPPEYHKLPQRYSKEYYRIEWAGGVKQSTRTNVPVKYSQRDVSTLIDKSSSHRACKLYGVSHSAIQNWCKGIPDEAEDAETKAEESAS